MMAHTQSEIINYVVQTGRTHTHYDIVIVIDHRYCLPAVENEWARRGIAYVCTYIHIYTCNVLHVM